MQGALRVKRCVNGVARTQNDFVYQGTVETGDFQDKTACFRSLLAVRRVRSMQHAVFSGQYVC